MNKQMFFLFFLFCAASAEVIFTVDTDRSGFSSVTVSLEAEEGTEVLLPADATSFRIVGGSYSLQDGMAIISSGKSGFTTFSFTTNMFTEKTGSGWHLSFIAPNNSHAFVFMPPFTTIESSNPQPARVTSEDSRTVLELNADSISVSYSLGSIPLAEHDEGISFLLYGGVLLAVLGAAFLFFRSRKNSEFGKFESRSTLDITDGKLEMMETFNDNDRKIIGFLIDAGGKARRNELERKTEISKSSLAIALNRLERRKILEIDRTSTTHFVKISEYFLKL